MSVKPLKEGCVTNTTLLFCIFWIHLNENIAYLCAHYYFLEVCFHSFC